MKNIEERVEQAIIKEVNALGYELYDVEYVKEGKDYYLRIYIDRAKEGISLDDCEKVSNCINEMLDKLDIIQEQYFLEVSSPGIERILRKDKHLKDNINKDIQVKLFKKYNNKKEYTGILKSFDDKYIYITEQSEELKIDRKDIAQIKTIYNW